MCVLSRQADFGPGPPSPPLFGTQPTPRLGGKTCCVLKRRGGPPLSQARPWTWTTGHGHPRSRSTPSWPEPQFVMFYKGFYTFPLVRPARSGRPPAWPASGRYFFLSAQTNKSVCADKEISGPGMQTKESVPPKVAHSRCTLTRNRRPGRPAK